MMNISIVMSLVFQSLWNASMKELLNKTRLEFIVTSPRFLKIQLTMSARDRSSVQWIFENYEVSYTEEDTIHERIVISSKYVVLNDEYESCIRGNYKRIRVDISL